jgi:PAS domain S-box-containing protein
MRSRRPLADPRRDGPRPPCVAPLWPLHGGPPDSPADGAHPTGAERWAAWIARYAQVEVVALLLADPHSGGLRLAASHGAPAEALAPADWRLASRPHLPVAVLSPLDPSARAALAAWWRARGAILRWARTLWLGDELLGLVGAGGRRPDPLSAAQRRRLHAAALCLRDALLAERAPDAGRRALASPAARWRTLVEHAVDLAVVVDAAGRVVYCNPAVGRLLGYAPRALVGRPLVSLAATARDAAALRALLDQPGGEQAPRVRLRHQDGTSRLVEVTAVGRRGGPGRTAVLLWARDREEQERLETELHQAQKLEVVGRLASGVVHDFNNLLTVISGHTELLLAALAADDPRREFATEIARAASDAAALASQLLAFSRRQEPAPEVLDLNALVLATARMLRRLLGEHIRVETELEPQLGAVRADPLQVQQALLNLPVNARDAMPHGGCLRLRTANVFWSEPGDERGVVAAPGGGVLLSVSDTGTGIPRTVLGYIFEPFFTTKQEGRGTGLGLATVYRIMRQNGGSVWVSSHEGAGTTFTLHFPRVDAPRPHAPVGAAHSVRATGQETVLVVEDEPAVRALAARWLQARGYTVLTAPTGRAALDLSAEHAGPLHLLVTDVVLPDLPGHALAQQLAAARPELRVVYISGYDAETVRGRGLLPAGGDYLPKPLAAETLAARVRAALDARVTD